MIAKLSQSGMAQAVLTLLNRVPVPYERWPVDVGGFRLAGHSLDRYIALWLRKAVRWEAAEVDSIQRLCPPGSLVVDIGANIGFYALAFARAVGPSGHVWAFEPDPRNFRSLATNIRLNVAANITPVMRAVSAESGEAQLYRSGANGGDCRLVPFAQAIAAEAVETTALDDFFPEPSARITLIKIDVQGAEGLALAGMSRILRTNRPITLVMEFWPYGLSSYGIEPAEVLRHLVDLGFSVRLLDPREPAAPLIGDIEAFVRGLPAKAYVTIVATAPDDGSERGSRAG
jgi:FkbM family methyltransferase